MTNYELNLVRLAKQRAAQRCPGSATLNCKRSFLQCFLIVLVLRRFAGTRTRWYGFTNEREREYECECEYEYEYELGLERPSYYHQH